jgi:hypothetical protein
VAVSDKALGERPAQESRAARDDDLHCRNQNTE